MNSQRKVFVSGVVYSAISKYSGIVISIIIGSVLSRLLSPEEFGLVALITVFISFFNLLSDFGLGPAITQSQSISSKEIQFIFNFSLILGFFFAILFYCSSFFISKFYENFDLLKLSKLLSLSVLFFSFQVVPKAVLQKKMRFKIIGFISLFVQLLGGFLAVILAYLGFGVYALVLQSIFVSFISFALYFYYSSLKFQFILNFNPVSKVLKFSLFQFGFNFINYFSRNSDNILIGKFLMPSSLGFYDKSYKLMLLPVQNLTHVISPVLLPIFSKYQNDSNYVFGKFLIIIRFLSTVGFPLSVFLYFSANELILVLYGDQWINSVSVFEWLALSVGFQIILSLSGSMFQVFERTDLMFLTGVISSFFMILCILLGIFFGGDIESVGLALIFSFSINFFQSFFILIKFVFKDSFLSFISVLLWPLVFSVLLFLSYFFLNFYISNFSLIISLIIKIILFSLFVFLCFLTNKEVKMIFFKFILYK